MIRPLPTLRSLLFANPELRPNRGRFAMQCNCGKQKWFRRTKETAERIAGRLVIEFALSVRKVTATTTLISPAVRLAAEAGRGLKQLLVLLALSDRYSAKRRIEPRRFVKYCKARFGSVMLSP